MILKAHVGVGIVGAEGQQAANASDYSIPRFSCLKRLLLVHGRWMNRRMAILTLYMYYKNVLLVLPQFFFGCYCLFSGQSTYYDPLYQLFNVWYTALPIMLFSVYDEDVGDSISLKYPSLYLEGSKHSFISIKKFWLWILDASISSLVVLFIPVGVFASGSLMLNGLNVGLWDMGLLMNFIVVIVANFRLGLEIKCWYWFLAASIAASIALWIASAYGFSMFISFGREFYNVLYIANSYAAGFTVLLSCSLCLFGAYIVKAYSTSFAPNPSDICHEIDVLNKRKYSNKVADSMFQMKQ